MSASALGEELLGEIREESLDVLLRSLQQPSSPPTSQLGVPSLDRLIAIFQTPPTARPPPQHTQWPTQAQAPTAQPAKEKLPPVVEITGATCSGKTQLLYYIIAITLLPRTHNDVSLDGNESAAVLIDLSHRFSILRLKDVMRACISSKTVDSSTILSEEDVNPLIHASLTHLHVFRPHSTPSLLTTLNAIPDYLLAQPSTHFSANRALGLIAIIDISAFLQQDRLESEEAETSTTAPNHTTSLLQTRYQSITAALQKIQLLFSAPAVATTRALSTPTSGPNPPSLRPHLPAAWNNVCTVQVVVQRDQVTKFGPGMSAEEASGEKAQRWEAVQRGGFSGWVNWWGSGGWREEVREGLRRLDGGGRFGFKVDEGGVNL